MEVYERFWRGRKTLLHPSSVYERLMVRATDNVLSEQSSSSSFINKLAQLSELIQTVVEGKFL